MAIQEGGKLCILLAEFHIKYTSDTHPLPTYLHTCAPPVYVLLSIPTMTPKSHKNSLPQQNMILPPLQSAEQELQNL